MANAESVAESSRGSAHGRSSDETLVAQPTDPGPLPKKQGELGWAPSQDSSTQGEVAASTGDLPVRHPADRPSSPAPTSAPEPVLPPAGANASSSSLQSQSSVFKQFLRAPRPLPKINGIRATTILRVLLLVSTLIGSIIGWVITVVHMNAWNAKANASPPIPDQPPTQGPGNSTTPAAPAAQQQYNQMADSSLAFVHVAFGAAVSFQLLMLERAVYRLRAERYAFLHPDEMAAAAMAAGSGPVMGLAPWNRPPLPTYAAALGIRGTGDVEDNIIAAPPPPEYGNTRGSTLLLSAHLPSQLTRSASTFSRPTSQRTIRDALGRPMDAWSRPVSYCEDELRQSARRSLDLESALSRLEGSRMSQVASEPVTRPENAVVRS
ncbi:hypothetical protein FRC10_011893 [Ceratobasidium sp. 414]|nr:hypothetical protein FRC10_011893 [Ceratobasidium sp. 414]